MKQRMYATVRRYEGVADTASAAKAVDEKFVPFISSLHGFVEYYWIDLGTGAMISITVFEKLSDAIEANDKARAWVKQHLAGILPNPSRVEAGVIVAHTGKS
jgi:hypothetical protein